MKRFAALSAALVLSLTSVQAVQAQPAPTYQASGVVKSVNVDKGTVSIAHGPVASLSWPAMTMAFAAEDRKLLQNLKPGAKVEFEFVQQGPRYVITSVK
jgi:Cu/Ag efflux protein CusF